MRSFRIDISHLGTLMTMISWPRISAKQKRCDLLSLIVCTDPCVYQQDGYCSLARAASCGSTGGSGCVNFVPRLQNGGQCFPDVGHPDQLQPLRHRQLSLDPLRDQAFGKSQPPHLTPAAVPGRSPPAARRSGRPLRWRPSRWARACPESWRQRPAWRPGRRRAPPVRGRQSRSHRHRSR